MRTNKGLSGQPASISFKESDRQVHLLVSDIKCTKLPVMDVELASVGGLSDPYILFVSYPKSILWEKAWPSTNVVPRNLNPIWEQDIHMTLDGDGCRNDEGHVSFNGCMLYMTVMDEDFGSADDIIGTVALSLNELCSKLATDKVNDHSPVSIVESVISMPILRDGRERGMLECTITAAYLTPNDVKSFLSRSTREVRSKKKRRNKFLGMATAQGELGRHFQY